MSTHNICFHGEIRKNILWIPPPICSYGKRHFTAPDKIQKVCNLGHLTTPNFSPPTLKVFSRIFFFEFPCLAILFSYIKTFNKIKIFSSLPSLF